MEYKVISLENQAGVLTLIQNKLNELFEDGWKPIIVLGSSNNIVILERLKENE